MDSGIDDGRVPVDQKPSYTGKAKDMMEQRAWRDWRTAGLSAILTVRRKRPAPARPAKARSA
ncbi:protein of unknown function [Azospirillum baldaniorum]|uniref:Uncharacterized protein n=1 Tax=Azospirillum baldaniorum TaxID=1064539 RepID=A0A9P1JSU0_9PROT|nr:protein of unknown function [Azospirillum baldaniorum]